MLDHNYSSIETAKSLSVNEIRDKLSALRSYTCPGSYITQYAGGFTGKQLLTALTNDDSDGVQNILLESNPEGMLSAMIALQKAFSLSDVICILREGISGESLKKLAEENSVDIQFFTADIVDTRTYNNALMLSFEELAAISDVLVGQVPGILLQIDEKDVCEVPFETLPEEFNNPDAKAFLCGHRFLQAPLGSLSSENWYGSGRVRTLTDSDCMIRAAKEEVHRQRERSCGKCTFCREGLYQLEAVLTDITLGKARSDSLALLQELDEFMCGLNNCSLGNTAAFAVSSVMGSFREELAEHLDDRYCRAQECDAFITYCIDPTKCRSCQDCVKVCEAGCIDFKKGYTSVIDEYGCVKCGKCVQACPNGAIGRFSGTGKMIEQKMIRIKGMETGSEKTEKREHSRKRIKRTLPEVKTPVFQESENRKEPERSMIMERLQTDAVVVAGGPAGLAAAVTLGEHGLKSILFEKSSSTGGAANMGMGILGIDTHIQKRHFNDLTVDKALKMHMEYTHYQVDSDLVQAYFHKSADTVKWLESLGVEFAGAYRYFRESEATWHIVKPDNGIIGPRAAGKMARILTEKAREYGCDIRLETPVVDLITEDGKVCGVIAKDKEGNLIEVRSKAVVVATGGFGNNKKMIYDKFGLTLNEDYFPFQIPGIDGDGLNMMWKAGAAEFGTNIEAIYQLPDNANWSVLDGVLRQPNLLINQFGERFMNEGDMGNTTYTGNALRLQPGHYGYCIMDDGILRYYKKNGPDMISLVHAPEMINDFDEQAEKAVRQGYEGYFEAKTIAELAEKLDIDPDVLEDTIEEYNEMCENGIDTKFHKDQRFLHPITGKGKYYAGKFYLGAYGTIGGVRINKYCEVLDSRCLPIEGLYSAGTDANTIYGDSYNFTLPGNSMGFAVNTGRMAAESIAEYIADLG